MKKEPEIYYSLASLLVGKIEPKVLHISYSISLNKMLMRIYLLNDSSKLTIDLEKEILKEFGLNFPKLNVFVFIDFLSSNEFNTGDFIKLKRFLFQRIEITDL